MAKNGGNRPAECTENIEDRYNRCGFLNTIEHIDIYGRMKKSYTEKRWNLSHPECVSAISCCSSKFKEQNNDIKVAEKLSTFSITTKCCGLYPGNDILSKKTKKKQQKCINNQTMSCDETEESKSDDVFEKLVAPQAAPRKYEIIHSNLLTFSYGHLAALYGTYLCVTVASWKTLLFHFIIFVLAAIGVTAGAHRLWTHRAYKAKLPLQIILMLMNTLAFQNTVIDWVKKHRLHHRYSDTDADPHNATRGFFYSHVGWLLVKRHEEVRRREKLIDMSDIYDNPVLTFQKKYAVPFIGTLTFVLPTLIPMYFFGETFWTAWHLTVLRYILNLNGTFLVNSAAHMFGNKPYEEHIKPSQNLFVSFVSFGEGFHNYHHVFPWDYRTAELGNNYLNLTTKFIDFFAWLGWAYDRKTIPDDLIRSRSKRTGDGTNSWGFSKTE
ncbi:Acyl-CoA Delta [Danaus plexippus plexippus]|uniref:Acyl-CoA Delta n=1 Tax=Danaus plexippus plexippus TaxID=278856 RepID=A0A212FJD3_DANPL|nr:Acyl-CoA Delta [Danaus plexippus plexippus]